MEVFESGIIYETCSPLCRVCKYSLHLLMYVGTTWADVILRIKKDLVTGQMLLS